MFARLGKSLVDLWNNRIEEDVRAATAKAKAEASSADPRAQAMAAVRGAQGKVMTAERSALIRRAMEVHRAKQAILVDLDDEQKQKLVAMALRAFLNEGREDGGRESPTRAAKTAVRSSPSAAKSAGGDRAGKANAGNSGSGNRKKNYDRKV